MTLTTSKIISCLAMACATLSLIATPAQAKRLGGGSGSKIGRSVNNAAMQRPSAPMVAPRPTAPSYNTPAPAAAKPANRWLGPLAGVAAGIGLASLMSHSGVGAGMADTLSSLLTYGALALLALFVYRRFFANKAAAVLGNAAGSPNTNTPSNNPYSAPVNAYVAPEVTAPIHSSNDSSATLAPAAYASNNHASVPDVNAFTHNAKNQYLALQAAWDAGDLSKLRTMATDTLFMDFAQEIANRKGAPNHTEIMNLHCELLDVRDEAHETVATLRFTGTAREDNNPTTSLEDIWMLTKPANAATGWLLAGVENK
jgi:predicted lipid-binding transport protein (Tim44 family)